MAYATDGKIGIPLTTVASADGFTGGQTPATLGETVVGSGNSEWMFVVAGAAITLGDCVVIDQNYSAQPITDTLAASPGAMVGFAQAAFTTSQYGFVARRGNGISIRISGGATTPGVPLFTSNTAGALAVATNSGSAYQIWGAFTLTTVSGTTASACSNGLASFPLVRAPK